MSRIMAIRTKAAARRRRVITILRVFASFTIATLAAVSTRWSEAQTTFSDPFQAVRPGDRPEPQPRPPAARPPPRTTLAPESTRSRFDGIYRGVTTCDTLPNGPSHSAPVSVTVAGQTVVAEMEVRVATPSGEDLGRREIVRATGTIQSTGRIAISGQSERRAGEMVLSNGRRVMAAHVIDQFNSTGQISGDTMQIQGSGQKTVLSPGVQSSVRYVCRTTLSRR
jgi:hypothetical protein